MLASPVVHGVTGHFSSCVWYLRVSPDDTRGCQCPFVLCLHQKGPGKFPKVPGRRSPLESRRGSLGAP